MNFINRLKEKLLFVCKQLSPSEFAWRGAASAILLLALLMFLALLLTQVLPNFSWQKLLAVTVLIAAILLTGSLALLLIKIIMRLQPYFRSTLFIVSPVVVLLLMPVGGVRGIGLAAAALAMVALAGASIAVLRQNGFKPQTQKVTLACLFASALILTSGIYLLYGPTKTANPSLDDYHLSDRTLDLPDPGVPGTYPVMTFTYGSGTDRHRPEYGSEVDVVTAAVDASKLVDNWDGLGGWLRTKYWGFGADALPLQARVWYPQGTGSFPLVLVVHGNHDMEDFSDPGYDYLGELLASRGYILASVDENFINSSFADVIDFYEESGLDEENDARGWLLLKHLQLWRDWAGQEDHLMHGKVDMDHVALIGHSRGGEAVAVAAAFNQLQRYPDDATLEFDFGFELDGVIAIAPVDGQYKPRESGTPINDVNYFTIHGSMDGDVQSFMGTQQYSRVFFPKTASADHFRFKSSLYLLGANHGQFNTSWGRLDIPRFWSWVLNTDGIMNAEDQRQVAKVYFSAFLEVVLRDQHEYLALFTDARYGANWLPDTFYLNQYADSRSTIIANFEEDIDPVTATLNGAEIQSQGLTRWRESMVKLKWRELDTHAAFLSWNSDYGEDTARLDFLLPASWSDTSETAQLSFSLAEGDSGTKPKDWEQQDEKKNNTDTTDITDDDAADEDERETLDWSIVLVDQSGDRASLPLSHDQVLYPQVQAKPKRSDLLEDNDTSEVLFRHYGFPLSDFSASNPNFEASKLVKISFVFDRAAAGSIIVDDLALGPSLLAPPPFWQR